MVCATNANVEQAEQVEQVEQVEHAEHAEQAEQVRLFRCPKCRRTYGDPMYHGPAGHAPHALCFDCWASEWGVYEALIARGRRWRQLDAALFLLCQGFTYAEAGRVLGTTHDSVLHWIGYLRRYPGELPDWLREFRARRFGPRVLPRLPHGRR